MGELRKEDNTLITYSKHSPTGFDRAGAFLPDRQDWLVLPVSRNRDSEPLDESNFAESIKLLGGESESVEIHRFGHWACGWYEIILIDPGSKSKAIADSIELRLENYPILNESDLEMREFEAVNE